MALNSTLASRGVPHPKSKSPDDPEHLLWVVCLCAAWCRACDEYRPVFAQATDSAEALHPQLRLVWLDIEDRADLVGDLEFNHFPSLLIANDAGVRFLGPITPQPGTLTRLMEAMQQPAAATAPHTPETRAIIDFLATN